MTEFDPFSVQIPSGTVLLEGPVSQFSPVENPAPQEKVVLAELVDQFKDTEIGSFQLIKGAFQSSDVDYASSVLFNELPELGLTRRESFNEVRFGQLILRSVFGEERAELAAMKSFTGVKKATHEFALARYFNGRNGRSHGFRTFEPLGLARQPTGEYSIISKYEHGVISQDNVFDNPEHQPGSQAIMRALGRCATVLGSIHSEGWTHGDTQTKNFFVSNFHELFIADLESMKPLRLRHGDVDELSAREVIDSDLMTLFRSINARFKGERPHLDAVENTFGLIYASITSSSLSSVPREIRKTSADILELYDAS